MQRDVKVSKQLRAEILGELPTCYWCGWTSHPDEFEADHLVPLSKGGRTVAENLVPACVSCNRSRQDRPAEESWRWVSRSQYLRLSPAAQEEAMFAAMHRVAEARRASRR